MIRKIIKLVVLIVIWITAWLTLAIFFIIFFEENGSTATEGRFIWAILAALLDCYVFWKGYKISTNE